MLATLSLTAEAFEVALSPAEARALGRSRLKLDLSRLMSYRQVKFPGKLALGYRVSKTTLFNPLFGEYNNGLETSLVVGDLLSSTKGLQISFAHPSFDKVWVFGEQVSELEQKLAEFHEMSKKPVFEGFSRHSVMKGTQWLNS